jgi:hypothetical protein
MIKQTNLAMISNKKRKTSYMLRNQKANEVNTSNPKLPSNKATIDNGTPKASKDNLVEMPLSPLTPKANLDEEAKKKKKRVVDSRDVWTQTDRSDYMLIKYRQK